MISKENAEHYSWGDRCDGWYLMNRKDMLVIHEKMPPGTREKRHYHASSRQFSLFFRACYRWNWRAKCMISVRNRESKFRHTLNTRPEITAMCQ